jgi:hypothetical protein
LKSAMVFEGISGVVSAEHGDHEDLGRVPSLNTKTREVSDMQDMYRRTLAASWVSRASDIPADKLIEELFSGVSVSTIGAQGSRTGRPVETNNDGPLLSVDADVEPRRTGATNRLAPSFERRQKSTSGSRLKGSDFQSTMGHSRKNGSMEQQLFESAKGKGWKTRTGENELSEFDVRQDLRSWDISSKE